MSLQNPITEPQIPRDIARDKEFQAADQALIAAHLATPNHTQYLPVNPVHIEFKPSQFNIIDFNTQQGSNGEQVRDFDGRISASGGGVTNALGFLLFQFAHIQFNSKVSINNGAQLARLLSAVQSIDLPSVGPGTQVSVAIAVAGAVLGDAVLFFPVTVVANLTFFSIQAIITAAETVTIYFRNLSSSAIDLPAFSARIVVLGF
jgi:hypothetical protein